MRKNRFLFTIFAAVIFILPIHIIPCTTFCFRDGVDWVYGRNYDWDIGYCLITVNKRGVAKTAFTENSPAKWTSKYGSITFNQYGREFPLGGMNEAGLVIECMWLQQTQYPRPDSRTELTELQWIQYQLDNHASVGDVIASDKTVRITFRDMAPLHFLVCDAKGDAAAVEFLGGKMVVHRKGKNLPAPALANSTYQQSKQLLETLDKEKQSGVFTAANYSLKRFIWAAQGVREWGSKTHGSPIDYAFKLLRQVTVSRTMFSIVYDVKNRRIYYRTKDDSTIRFFNFNGFKFDSRTPVKILDIAKGGKGDITASFRPYTYEANLELLRKSYAGTRFLQNVPEDEILRTARYPDHVARGPSLHGPGGR